MRIVVTGTTGVGKTSILKSLNSNRVLFVDELVKKVFYKRGHLVFNLVVAEYGEEVVDDEVIDTSRLSEMVIEKEEELNKLALIVMPFIIEYVNSLNGDWVVELATYLNYESCFKTIFDKVVLIKRPPNLVENKFKNSKGEAIHTIKENTINADLIIKNNTSIEAAKSELTDFLLSIGFKNI